MNKKFNTKTLFFILKFFIDHSLQGFPNFEELKEFGSLANKVLSQF
jgi:hypothetical protein